MIFFQRWSNVLALYPPQLNILSANSVVLWVRLWLMTSMLTVWFVHVLISWETSPNSGRCPKTSAGNDHSCIHFFTTWLLQLTFSTYLSKTPMNHLQVLQNAAVKLLTKVTERSPVSPSRTSLHWLSIQLRIQSKIMVITFRALHDEASSYNSF